MTNYIQDSKRLHEGVLNALEQATDLIMEKTNSTEEDKSQTLGDIQSTLSDWVNEFI